MGASQKQNRAVGEFDVCGHCRAIAVEENDFHVDHPAVSLARLDMEQTPARQREIYHFAQCGTSFGVVDELIGCVVEQMQLSAVRLQPRIETLIGVGGENRIYLDLYTRRRSTCQRRRYEPGNQETSESYRPSQIRPQTQLPSASSGIQMTVVLLSGSFQTATDGFSVSSREITICPPPSEFTVCSSGTLD